MKTDDIVSLLFVGLNLYNWKKHDNTFSLWVAIALAIFVFVSNYPTIRGLF